MCAVVAAVALPTAPRICMHHTRFDTSFHAHLLFGPVTARPVHMGLVWVTVHPAAPRPGRLMLVVPVQCCTDSSGSCVPDHTHYPSRALLFLLLLGGTHCNTCVQAELGISSVLAVLAVPCGLHLWPLLVGCRAVGCAGCCPADARKGCLRIRWLCDDKAPRLVCTAGEASCLEGASCCCVPACSLTFTHRVPPGASWSGHMALMTCMIVGSYVGKLELPQALVSCYLGRRRQVGAAVGLYMAGPGCLVCL